jgi:hypothetical protein
VASKEVLNSMELASYGLFNDAAHSSHYIALNRMIVRE